MDEFLQKTTKIEKNIEPKALWLSIPIILVHAFILSLAIVPTIEIPNKKIFSNTIQLDQFSVKKDEISKLSLPNSKLIKNSSNHKPLNLGNLGLGINSQLSNTNLEKNFGKTIEDKVSNSQSSNLKSNEVTLIERSEARELLNRHRQRLRSPDIQYNQESKVQSLNNKLGAFQPGQVTDFNISIVPNNKNSKEDLNSIERKFYAFYVRLSDKYESVISSTMINGLTKRPQLKTSLYDRHTLQAKIVYDKNGEIVSTKILKSSNSMDVHETFEEIVALLKLPNVPLGLLDEDEQYTVYFTFQIN